MKHSYFSITSINFKPLALNRLGIIIALAFLPLFAFAQVSMTVVGTNTYTQDFNSLTKTVTATWSNNLTLPGWYVQQGAKVPTVITPNNGSNNNPELFSLGDGPADDRSLGSISTVAAGKHVYVLRLKNNTNTVVNRINVSFDLIQWWNNAGNNDRFGVSFLTGNTSAIEATIADKQLNSTSGWVVANNKIQVPSKGRPGYKPGDKKSVSLDLTGFSLAVGEEILVRFEDAMNTKKFGYNAIGVDNVSIIANPTTSINSKIYHFVGGRGNDKDDLTLTTNWKTNPNGSGDSPVNFTDDFQMFLIDVANKNGNGQPNTQTPTLTKEWEVKGMDSKVILGNSTQNFSLTISQTASFNATIDLTSQSTLAVNNSNNYDANGMNSPAVSFDIIEDNSMVIYGGNEPQYVSEADYYNLEVSGSGPKNLTGAISATGTLNLNTTKNLTLGIHDLLVGDGNTTAGNILSDGGYVITNSTGSLQRAVINNNTDIFFPVGRTSYNPARLKLGTASQSDVFSVRIQSGLFDNYDEDNIGVEPAVIDGVSRTWIIEEAIPGGSDASLSLLFSAGNANNDWAPAFDPGKAVLAQYNDSWTAPTIGKANPSTDNMLEVSQANISSFRLFGVFNNDHQGLVTLPVELLSFTARRLKSEVELKWQTAMEKNNDFFTVEASTDGNVFYPVTTVKGAGNTNQQKNYSFLHQHAPAQATYYRLKQTDFDGTFAYSAVVAVSGTSRLGTLAVYPNPSTGRYTLQGATDVTSALVVDATGRIVMELTKTTNESGLNVNLADQKPGVYFLRLTSPLETKTLRLIKN